MWFKTCAGSMRSTAQRGIRSGTSSRSAARSQETVPATASPRQARAAVWHSLIAGARGIIYFQHSFSGPCVNHHALRDNGCYQAMIDTITSVDAQIRSIAPALNGPRPHLGVLRQLDRRGRRRNGTARTSTSSPAQPKTAGRSRAPSPFPASATPPPPSSAKTAPSRSAQDRSATPSPTATPSTSTASTADPPAV